MRHGSVTRPTFVLGQHGHQDGLRRGKDQKHIANTVGDHEVHGWIIAALLGEMAGLEGQATVESVESKFSFARCIRQGSVEALRLWLKMAMQILGNVEPEWVETKMGVVVDNCEGQAHQNGHAQNGSRKIWADVQLHVGGQMLDLVVLEQMMKDLIEEARGTWNRKKAILRWTSTYADEMMDGMSISTRVGQHRKPLKKCFKILGYTFNQAGKTQYCLEGRGIQNANKAWWRDVKM